MRKIIEILSQLIFSTAIFGGIFYIALPKYDHVEAQNTLRNHATIMLRVQQGLGKVLTVYTPYCILYYMTNVICGICHRKSYEPQKYWQRK